MPQIPLPPTTLRAFLSLLLLLLMAVIPLWADTHAAGEGADAPLLFAWIGIFLIVAKVSSLVQKFGQPAVLGELLAGILLGNLALFGVQFFEPVRTNTTIHFLAELGVVILLFQVGLEADIQQMRKVGMRSLAVAFAGVALPFALGYVLGPLIFPGMTSNAAIFLGAILTATSVGITARVFRDLNVAHTAEARIVLGAAVIDDVLGLIILAVVQAIVQSGSVAFGDIAVISAKALLFLGGSFALGRASAPYIGRMFSLISTGQGMKFTAAIVFGLLLAYLAHLIGLAPIIGAFAAGLILDAVHFRHFDDPAFVRQVTDITKNAPTEVRVAINESLQQLSRKHIDELLEPVSYLLVPIFFVYTGFNVNLTTFLNPQVLLAGLIISAAAIVGKVAAGVAAGSVNKWIVGWGMMPRGEVGLIFAATGKNLGVIDDEIYSVVMMMVVLSTLLTPPLLTAALRKQQRKNKGRNHPASI